MKKLLIILLGYLLISPTALSATLKGKVVDNKDGITPIPSEFVLIYQWDAINNYFIYYSYILTNSAGSFSVPAVPPGGYLVTIGNGYYSGFYSSGIANVYFPETYDDVSILNPNTAPTVISVNTADVTLKLIKLSQRPFYINDAISVTINNGTPTSYPYFGAYPGYAPLLPNTGGNIKCGFNAYNTSGSAITAKLQWVAYLQRGTNLLPYTGLTSMVPLAAAQTVTLNSGTQASPGKTALSCNGATGLTIPGSFLTGPHNKGVLGFEYAFRLTGYLTLNGLALAQSVDIPIAHTSTSATSPSFVPEMAPADRPDRIPLKISADGRQVLEWGQRPTE